ncbi:MAG: cytochrome c [Deltaproteobacteria bacterium]|nr:cytochrome c [Myxococcales bacterium]MDP3220491.1 cytochrome c [Deltaproteobacteria bacterium]
MQRLLSTAFCLSLAACSSTPAPPVQRPPPVTTPTPTPRPTPTPPTPVEPVDAGAPVEPAPAPSDAGTPTTPADDAGVAIPRPPPPTPRPTGNAITQGRAVFARVCGRCHEDGDDEGPNPNLRWTEARMRTLVRSGNSRMRAIPASRLSDADLALVMAYLRSIRAIQ